MRLKQVVTSVLLVFVVGSLGYLLVDESGNLEKKEAQEAVPETAIAESPENEDPESPTEQMDRRLVAYYFHGNVRCPTCLSIEEYAKEVLTTTFSAELASGALEWQSVNTDEVWNSHYWKDFNLSFSSLVIADVSGAETVHFKNLDKVWELVHEKESFFDYVRSETQSFLEAPL